MGNGGSRSKFPTFFKKIGKVARHKMLKFINIEGKTWPFHPISVTEGKCGSVNMGEENDSYQGSRIFHPQHRETNQKDFPFLDGLPKINSRSALANNIFDKRGGEKGRKPIC